MVSGLFRLLATAVLAVPPLPTGTDVDYQLGGAGRDKRRKIAEIVTRWTRGCAKHGFDAVEYAADDFEATCEAYGDTHAAVLRDRDLSPEGVHQWC